MPPISTPLKRWLGGQWDDNLPKARLFALGAIAISLVLDLAIKRLFLAEITSWNFRTVVPGLLDTHYSWNRGVSFSLFWQNSDLGSAALSALLMGVVIALAISALRTPRPIFAAGMGFIVGAALGNILDRATGGAVFDFFLVRFGAQPLFVCNSADLFISLGVLLLAADMLFFEDTPKA